MPHSDVVPLKYGIDELDSFSDIDASLPLEMPVNEILPVDLHVSEVFLPIQQVYDLDDVLRKINQFDVKKIL